MAEGARVLLDADAFLGALDGGARLGSAARAALEDERTEVWLSASTVWEIGIKASLGRLTLPAPLGEVVRRSVSEASVRILAVTAEHGVHATELPPHHRDPFDRMLVAQARAEGLVLISRDRALAAYPVDLLW